MEPRLSIIEYYPNHPIQFLLQSIHFEDPVNLAKTTAILAQHSDLKLYVRNKVSLAFARKTSGRKAFWLDSKIWLQSPLLNLTVQRQCPRLRLYDWCKARLARYIQCDVRYVRSMTVGLSMWSGLKIEVLSGCCFIAWIQRGPTENWTISRPCTHFFRWTGVWLSIIYRLRDLHSTTVAPMLGSSWGLGFSVKQRSLY